MGALSTGGGSSAVAASAHAGCQRYRHTDPLVVGRSRRAIAAQLGHPDTTAGIPEARWMRAMAFERLVHHERFVSQLLTTAVGALGLARPTAVRRAVGHVSVATTAAALQRAHVAAVDDDAATLITSLAVPFVGMEHVVGATPVKPDFAIVAPRPGNSAGRPADSPGRDGQPAVGSWLIMGDAKDYERVRSRIDDQRLLKGFLQVALGAESAATWSAVPPGMVVHDWGALAVPRNAFLQPEAVVERLADHRREVRVRVDERTQLLGELHAPPADDALRAFVDHLAADFDPARCTSCALFDHCRRELRASPDPAALLVEVGIRPELRPAVLGLLHGTGPAETAPASVVAGLKATLHGLPQFTGQRRVDPVGTPGSINVVLAKSDAAALGLHGVGVQRVAADGSTAPWQHVVFDDPQSPTTRAAVMHLLGQQIFAAMDDAARHSPSAPPPVCVVTPDGATGDVLVSIADSLAGVETSRLRWQRDLDQGRPALTFDGDPAVVPAPLSATERLAVSFLLEQDRARALTLRQPIVDLRNVLGAHVVAGGPHVDSGRLDHLVEWAEAREPLDHREVADAISNRAQTPGARLSNARSDAIHAALRGPVRRGTARGPVDLDRYRELVLDELGYKADVVSRAVAVLDQLPVSRLRSAHRAMEADAQAVWRARLRLHASDLVRFGRTSWVWRNSQVGLIDDDASCAAKLLAVGHPLVARDLALAAGTREMTLARVTSVRPLRVELRSRRITAGSQAVVLHVNGQPCIEAGTTGLRIQKGSFKFANLSMGPLVDDPGPGLRWDLKVPLDVAVGDELVVGDLSWFKSFTSGHELAIERPGCDKQSAPRPDCDESSFTADPWAHQWCCRSHEDAEAEWSDELAQRRARGELNPQTWPPVIDEDQFDTVAEGAPTEAAATTDGAAPTPLELTIDDLD